MANDKKKNLKSKAKKQTHRPNNPWFNNAMRSMGLVGTDLIKNMSPGVYEFVESNAKVTQETVKELRTNKINAKRIHDTMKENPYIKVGNDFITNAISDIKSGKFVNKEREKELEDKMVTEMFGDLDSMFDFGDDDEDSVSFGDEDGDDEYGDTYNNNVTNNNIITDPTSKAAGATLYIGEAIEKQSGINAYGFNQITETLTAIASNSLYTQKQMSGEIVTELRSINDVLTSMMEFNNENVNKFIEASIEYYSQTSKGKPEDEDIKDESSVFLSSGGLDLKNYLKHIAKSTKKTYGNSMIGLMIDMIVENPDIITGSPLSLIMSSMMGSLIPSVFKSSLKHLDTTFKSFFPTLLDKVADFKDSQNPFLSMFGRVFGVKEKRKNDFDLRKIDKGIVPFDGMTRHAIIEIIPTYLRKILSAVSNKEEMGFDWESGKYKSMSDMHEEVYGQVRDSVINAFSLSDVGDEISKYKEMLSGTDQEKFDRLLEKFYLALERTEKMFDPFNNTDGDPFLKVYGNLDRDYGKEMGDFLRASFKNMDTNAIMQINDIRQEARRSRKNLMNMMEENPYEYNLYSVAARSNIDNFIKDRTTPDIATLFGGGVSNAVLETDRNHVRHDRKMGVLDYLHDIKYLLNRGINVRVEQGSRYESTMTTNIIEERQNVDNNNDRDNIRRNETQTRENEDNIDTTLEDEENRRRREEQRERERTQRRFSDNPLGSVHDTLVNLRNNIVGDRNSNDTTPNRESEITPEDEPRNRREAERHRRLEERRRERENEGFFTRARNRIKDTVNAALSPRSSRHNRETLPEEDANPSVTQPLTETQNEEVQSSSRPEEHHRDDTPPNQREEQNEEYDEFLRRYREEEGKYTSSIIGTGKTEAEITKNIKEHERRSRVDAFGEELDEHEERGKGVAGKVRQILKPSAELASSGVRKVDDFLYGIVFGSNTQAFDTIARKVTEKISEGVHFITDKFITPLKKAAFGEKDENGYVRGGFFSGAQNRLKEFTNEVVHSFNGAGYVKSDGSTVEKAKPEDTVVGKVKSIFSTVRESVSEYLFGEKDEETGQRKSKGIISSGINTIKDGFKSWGEIIFGSNPKGDGAKREFVEEFKEDFKKKSQGTILGGLGGAAFTLLGGSSGILGGLFLPGGPIGGAIVGSAMGYVGQSERLRTYLFGEKDENGERLGGLISKQTQDFFKENKKSIIGGATVGTIKSLIFGGSSGFLGNLIGGPLLGAILGAGFGIVKKSNVFQEFLYGKGEEGEEGYKKGIIKSIKDKMKTEDGKSRLGLVASGGIAGGFGAALISQMGLMGALVGTAINPLVGVMIGAGAGLATSFEGVRKFLFGEFDEATGKRQGGIFKKLADFIDINLFQSMKLKMGEISLNVRKFLVEKMLNPIQDAIEPFTYQMKIIGQKVKHAVQDVTDRVVTSVRDNIIDPLTSAVSEYVIKPIKGFVNGIFNKLFGAIGFIVSSPFKLLSYITQGFVSSHQDLSFNQERANIWNRDNSGGKKGVKGFLNRTFGVGKNFIDTVKLYASSDRREAASQRNVTYLREGYLDNIRERNRAQQEAFDEQKEELMRKRAELNLRRMNANKNGYGKLYNPDEDEILDEIDNIDEAENGSKTKFFGRFIDRRRRRQERKEREKQKKERKITRAPQVEFNTEAVETLEERERIHREKRLQRKEEARKDREKKRQKEQEKKEREQRRKEREKENKKRVRRGSSPLPVEDEQPSAEIVRQPERKTVPNVPQPSAQLNITPETNVLRSIFGSDNKEQPLANTKPEKVKEPKTKVNRNAPTARLVSHEEVKRVDWKNTPERIKHIEDYTKTIKEEVKGQLNGVGANIYKIRKILNKRLRYDDDDTTGSDNLEGLSLTDRIFNAIQKPLKSIKSVLLAPVTLVTGFAKKLKDSIVGVVNGIKQIPGKIINVVQGIGAGIGTTLGGILSTVVTGAKAIGEGTLAVIVGVGKGAGHVIEGLATATASIIAGAGRTIGNAIGAIGNMIMAVPDFIAGTTEALGGLVKLIGTSIGSFLRSLTPAVKLVGSFVHETLNVVTTAVLGAANIILSPFRALGGFIGDTIGSLVGSVTGKKKHEYEIKGGFLDGIRTPVQIKNVISDIGKKPFHVFIDGVKDKLPVILNEGVVDNEPSLLGTIFGESDSSSRTPFATIIGLLTAISASVAGIATFQKFKGENVQPQSQQLQSQTDTNVTSIVPNLPNGNILSSLSSSTDAIVSGVGSMAAAAAVPFTSLHNVLGSFWEENQEQEEKEAKENEIKEDYKNASKRTAEFTRAEREKISSAELENERENRKLSLLERLTADNNGHRHDWLKIFGKTGLITGGLIFLFPHIWNLIKKLKNFSLFDNLKKVFEDILSKIGLSGGILQVLENIKDQIGKILNIFTPEGAKNLLDYIVHLPQKVAEYIFPDDGDGNPLTIGYDHTTESKLKGLFFNKTSFKVARGAKNAVVGAATKTANAVKKVKSGVDVVANSKVGQNVIGTAKDIAQDTAVKLKQDGAELVATAYGNTKHVLSSAKDKIVNNKVVQKVANPVKNIAQDTAVKISQDSAELMTNPIIAKAKDAALKAIDTLIGVIQKIATKFGVANGKLGNVIKFIKTNATKVLTSEKIVAKMGKFTKALGKTASAVSTAMAGDLFWMGASATTSALGGKGTAARMFQVDEQYVDNWMIVITTALNGLLGSSWGSFIDIINELIFEASSVSFVHMVAVMVYNTIMSVTGQQYKVNNLQSAKDNFVKSFIEDNKEEIDGAYEEYLSTVPEGEEPLSQEEFVMSSNYKGTSFAEYNAQQHKTFGSKLIDKWNTKVGTPLGNALKRGKEIVTNTTNKGKEVFAGIKDKVISAFSGNPTDALSKNGIVDDSQITKNLHQVQVDSNSVFNQVESFWSNMNNQYKEFSKTSTDWTKEGMNIVDIMMGQSFGIYDKQGYPIPISDAIRKGYGNRTSSMYRNINTSFIPTKGIGGISSMISSATSSITSTARSSMKMSGGGFGEGSKSDNKVRSYDEAFDVINSTENMDENEGLGFGEKPKGKTKIIQMQQPTEDKMVHKGLGFGVMDEMIKETTHKGFEALNAASQGADPSVKIKKDPVEDALSTSLGFLMPNTSDINDTIVDAYRKSAIDSTNAEVLDKNYNAQEISFSDMTDMKNNFAYYSQYDDRWASIPYGEGTIKSSGCGPTSMAMVATSLLGRKYLPEETAALSMKTGGYKNGQGTSYGFYNTAANYYGLHKTDVSASRQNLVNAIDSGKPMILSGNSKLNGGVPKDRSPFTPESHLVVAHGYTDNGQGVIINDPRGDKYSKVYNIDDVIKGTKAWFAFNRDDTKEHPYPTIGDGSPFPIYNEELEGSTSAYKAGRLQSGELGITSGSTSSTSSGGNIITNALDGASSILETVGSFIQEFANRAWNGAISGVWDSDYTSFFAGLNGTQQTTSSNSTSSSDGSAILHLPAGASDLESELVSLTRQVTSKNEGSYSTVVGYDNGPYSVGNMQYHGVKAKEFFTRLANRLSGSDKETALRYASMYTKSLSKSEANAMKAFLEKDSVSSINKEVQEQYANEITLQNMAVPLGMLKDGTLKDPRSVVLLSDIGNTGPSHLTEFKKNYKPTGDQTNELEYVRNALTTTSWWARQKSGRNSKYYNGWMNRINDTASALKSYQLQNSAEGLGYGEGPSYDNKVEEILKDRQKSKQPMNAKVIAPKIAIDKNEGLGFGSGTSTTSPQTIIHHEVTPVTKDITETRYSEPLMRLTNAKEQKINSDDKYIELMEMMLEAIMNNGENASDYYKKSLRSFDNFKVPQSSSNNMVVVPSQQNNQNSSINMSAGMGSIGKNERIARMIARGAF